jgi:hypothetical protein
MAKQGIRMHTPHNGGGNNWLEGRKAGVQGTYGDPRGKMGKGPIGHLTAEKTVAVGGRDSVGGGEDNLGPVAKAIYEKAVANGSGRDHLGDQALHER